MADDPTLPPTGTGTADIRPRAKDRAGIHTPIIGLDINVSGSEVLSTGDATNGLDVDVTRAQESSSSAATDTWDSSTAEDTAITLDVTIYGHAVVTLTPDGGTFDSGEVRLEVSPDGGTTWTGSPVLTEASMFGGFDALLLPNISESDTPDSDGFSVGGYTHARLRLATAITGTGQLDVRLTGDTSSGNARNTQYVAFTANTARVAIAGTDGAAFRTVATDASGELQVDVLTLPDATVVGKAADGAAPAGNPVLIAGQDGTNVQSLKTDTSGELQVDVLTLPNVTIGTMSALVAGNANIGDVDVATIAAGDNNIGNVDIVTMPNVTIGTMAALVAGSANIGDVDVLTVPTDPFGANADAASATGSISAKLRFIASTGIPVTGTVTVGSHAVTNAGTFATQIDGSALTALQLIDDPVFADEASFTTATSKLTMAGVKAVTSGSAPDDAGGTDRAVSPVANRNRVPFVIGGDPGVITLKHTTITTAVTDVAIVTIAGSNKIVVTRISVTLDNASTVFPTLLIGFGTTNTPTTTGVLVAHGGVPAGGGITVGDGSGILGIGGDGEDLRVTTTGNATGNGLQIVVTYYLVVA